MQTTYQQTIEKAQIKYFIGFAVLFLIAGISVLKSQQLSDSKLAILFLAVTIGFIFDYIKVTSFFKLFNQEKIKHSALDDSINSALKKILKWPLLFKAFNVELLTLYYAFFAKYEKQETTNESTSFSYSKLSNTKDIFWIVAIAQLPTLPLIHIALENSNQSALAWGITILTLWSVVWYLAQVQAVKFRPIELDDTLLKYRFGLFWKSDIPLGKITMARKVNYKDKIDGFAYFMSPLGSERNIILEFESPIRFIGPYFMSKRRKKAAITVDKPEQFLKQLPLKVCKFKEESFLSFKFV